MRSPWPSLTSAILRLPSLLHTPPLAWPRSPPKQCFQQLFPLAPAQLPLGNQPSCSGGSRPLPCRRPKWEHPLPSRVPHTSTARGSGGPPLQVKVKALFHMLLLIKLPPAFSKFTSVVLCASGQGEQHWRAEVKLTGHIEGVEFPVCPSPVKPAGFHLSPAEVRRQAGRAPLCQLQPHKPADATCEFITPFTSIPSRLLPAPGAASCVQRGHFVEI